MVSRRSIADSLRLMVIGNELQAEDEDEPHDQVQE